MLNIVKGKYSTAVPSLLSPKAPQLPSQHLLPFLLFKPHLVFVGWALADQSRSFLTNRDSSLQASHKVIDFQEDLSFPTHTFTATSQESY